MFYVLSEYSNKHFSSKSNHRILKKVGMWRLLYFYGLQISVCLNLSGFLFEDNKSSKRWVDDNGEITYRLSQWYANIGYV